MNEDLSKAFTKFKLAYSNAHRADAKLEYTDKGYKSAKEAWEKSDAAEAEFKKLLERVPA